MLLNCFSDKMKQIVFLYHITAAIISGTYADSNDGGLECQLFGDAGCTAYCDTVCDLFLCEPNQPTCDKSNTCQCYEKYVLLNGKTVTEMEFAKLDPEVLLKNMFESSSISDRLLEMLRQKNYRLSLFVAVMKGPRQNGSVIRSELLNACLQDHTISDEVYSDIKALKPRTQKIGNIYKYFTSLADLDPKTNRAYAFPVEEFDKHVKTVARQRARAVASSINEDAYKKAVGNFLRGITNANDLNKLMEYSNAISSASLTKTINSQLKTENYELVELNLSILTANEDIGTDYRKFADVQEYSLDYKPSDIDNVILINTVMQLFEAYKSERSGTTSVAAAFRVKMCNNAAGAKVQAWSTGSVEGFISKTTGNVYRKLWFNGEEKLRIVEDQEYDTVDLFWNIPSKRIAVSLNRRSGTDELSRKWMVRDNEIQFTKDQSDNTTTLWKAPDFQFRVITETSGKSDLLYFGVAPDILHLLKKPSDERLQCWKFKNVTILMNRENDSSIRNEKWNFAQSTGKYVSVGTGKVTNNVDLYKKHNTKYSNFILQFCEAVEYDYDACNI